MRPPLAKPTPLQQQPAAKNPCDQGHGHPRMGKEEWFSPAPMAPRKFSALYIIIGDETKSLLAKNPHNTTEKWSDLFGAP